MEPVLIKRCMLAYDPLRGVSRDTDILVEDGRIACIGECRGSSGIVVEADKHICMPALYNSHTHAAMTVLRGYHDDAVLHEWLREVWRAEERLTPGLVYQASRLAVMEMLSGGIAGFLDMYFYPLETARAAEELGIRARVGPVLMNPDSLERWESEARSTASSLKGSGLVGPVVNVHAIYTSGLEGVRIGVELAEELGIPLHIHVSETRREAYEVRKKYGRFPVELLRDEGLLSDRMVMVHMGWATSWEYMAVAESGARVVHCPVSNMKLATAGFLPLRDLIDSGITVGLGTDGPASNNTLDVFREIKTTVLLQRHSYWDTRVGARDALRAAILGGASILGVRAGRLLEGYEADIAVLDASSPGLQPLSEYNLESNLAYAASSRDVAYTIVAGRVVYSPEHEERFREEAWRIGRMLAGFVESIK